MEEIGTKCECILNHVAGLTRPDMKYVNAVGAGVISKREKLATIKGKFKTGTKAAALEKDTPGVFKFKLDSDTALVAVAVRFSLL